MSEALQEHNVLKEIKDVTAELGSRFDSFKKANDEKLSSGLLGLSNKVDALNEKISDLEAVKKSLEQDIVELKRPGFSGEKDAPDAYQKAFLDFLRSSDSTGEMRSKAFTSSEGKEAIPLQLDKRILELLSDESPMRKVCDQISLSTPEYKRVVNLNGAAFGWVGETDARPGTTAPLITTVSPKMCEIYANPSATQHALDDVFFDVEKWLLDEVKKGFAEGEGKAFLLGDQLKEPKGLLKHDINFLPDNARDFGVLQAVKNGHESEISADALLTLAYQLKQGYRKNAVWMMSSFTAAAVRRLKDSTGNYLWQAGLQLGQPATLLGRPVIENEDMPALGKDAASILFGDFKKAYCIVDRMGTSLLRDPYSHKPYVHFYVTKRVGSMLLDSQAVKVLKMSK